MNIATYMLCPLHIHVADIALIMYNNVHVICFLCLSRHVYYIFVAYHIASPRSKYKIGYNRYIVIVRAECFNIEDDHSQPLLDKNAKTFQQPL